MSDPCRYVGVEGEQCDKLHQVLEAAQAHKPKRKPSSYNLYVKACLKAKGGVKSFGEAGPKMKQCAQEYKSDKDKGHFRYEVEMPVEPGAPGPVLWKGRDLQKEFASLYGRVSGKRK